MSDPTRRSFGSVATARIWRTVVAAGAMLGAPAICAPEAAYADVGATGGSTMAPTAAAGDAATGRRVAQAGPKKPGTGSGTGTGTGTGTGSGTGSGTGTGTGTGTGSGSVLGTVNTKVTGSAPGTQPSKRPRTRRKRKNVGRGFILA
ncbi:MAG: hypothetical protein JNK64_00670 [Myxococcales bacterium]|nr:hypothetical protein [Myxococcales bacterium]